MDEVPYKNKIKYPEQMTFKVEPELKQVLEKLNSRGVDAPELCRIAIRRAAAEALESIEPEAS